MYAVLAQFSGAKLLNEIPNRTRWLLQIIYGGSSHYHLLSRRPRGAALSPSYRFWGRDLSLRQRRAKCRWLRPSEPPPLCTAAATVIRAQAVTNSAETLTIRVEKVNQQCAVSTFAASGTMELREGSKSGKAVAIATYAMGAAKVDLTFEPRVIGSATYYAVVASDKNLYTAGPITVTGLFVLSKEAAGVKLYQYTCSSTCATDYVL